MSASTRSSAARSPLRTSCSSRVTSPGSVAFVSSSGISEASKMAKAWPLLGRPGGDLLAIDDFVVDRGHHMMPSHSRNASTGSVRDARRPGIAHDATAAAARTSEIDTRVVGSLVPTPYTWGRQHATERQTHERAQDHADRRRHERLTDDEPHDRRCACADGHSHRELRATLRTFVASCCSTSGPLTSRST